MTTAPFRRLDRGCAVAPDPRPRAVPPDPAPAHSFRHRYTTRTRGRPARPWLAQLAPRSEKLASALATPTPLPPPPPAPRTPGLRQNRPYRARRCDRRHHCLRCSIVTPNQRAPESPAAATDDSPAATPAPAQPSIPADRRRHRVAPPSQRRGRPPVARSRRGYAASRGRKRTQEPHRRGQSRQQHDGLHRGRARRTAAASSISNEWGTDSDAEYNLHLLRLEQGHRRRAKQHIEVRKGTNPDIQTAIVRKMISIIREYETEDFMWLSLRLGREVKLSGTPGPTIRLQIIS